MRGLLADSRGAVHFHQTCHRRRRAGCASLQPRAFGSSGGGTVTLKNGVVIDYWSRPDVPFLSNEVFVERAYTQHGVTVKPGDRVIDIGANIGLARRFTIFCASEMQNRGTIVSVEPVPEIHALLQRNVRRNVSAAPGGVGEAGEALSISLLNLGAGEEEGRQVEFVFYRRAAGWTSMLPSDDEVMRNVVVYAARLAQQLSERLPARIGGWVQGFMERVLRSERDRGEEARRRGPAGAVAAALAWAFRGAVAALASFLLGGSVRIPCKLTTVSALMRRPELQGADVDLLKIDTERAELAVLRGVDPADWARIRQVSMEVHDVDGQLGEVLELLRTRGKFEKITSVQPRDFKGSTLWHVYCAR